MKLCVTLLKIVLVVVFVGVVLGDVEGNDVGSETVEGGASSGTVERVCPREASVEINRPLYVKVTDIWSPCFKKLEADNTDKLDRKNATTEDIQNFFNGFCPKMPILFECLKENSLDLEVCPDTTLLKVFNIMRELLVHHIECGCRHNGLGFVKIISEFKAFAPGLKKQVRDCTLVTMSIFQELREENIDISSTLFILHGQILELKDCVSKIELGSPLKEVVGDILNETIAIMKCIDQHDGSVVPCTSLKSTSVSFHSICEVKTQNTEISLYDMLEEEGLKWFNKIVTHDTRVEEMSSDNEKLREDFKQFCFSKTIPSFYLTEVSAFAKVCFNDTQEKEFKLLVDTINEALELACTDEGKRLADVMFEVYRLKKTSPDQSHAVWDCIDVAKATRKQSDDHRDSSKNMRFYHELETFKGCFLNKLHGDQTSVDAATSLINEMLKIVKCVKPQDGTTVTCEALMHSQGHAHGHTHGHAHGHNHEHAHGHTHGHSHEHVDEHSHDHAHAHEHTHEHVHDHAHSHAH